MGKQHIFSIPYKSKTNGAAERAIRSFKNLIQTNLKREWDMPIGVMNINRVLHEPRLRQLDMLESPACSLQIGDVVWKTRGPKREETLSDITGRGHLL